MAAADLRAELRCSICLDIYKDPVTLPCGHGFCLLCIDRTWHFEDDIVKRCPECNQRFRKILLKKNPKLHNIVEAYRQQQQLEEDQEKYRGELQEVLKSLFSRKESYSTSFQTQLDNIRHFQKNADGISEKIRTLFKDIQKQIKKLEHRVVDAISSWCDQAIESVYDIILKLEDWKDELDKEIQQCVDVMEEGTRDYSETEIPIANTEAPNEKAGDLPLALISELLYTGLSDLIAGVNIEEPMNVYLDIKPLHEQMSDDLKSSCQVPRIWNLHPQALSTSSISSAQHTWEVGSSASGVWRVGVYYSSMQSSANQFSIGNNKKSWCLRRYKNDYSVMHDNNEEQIPYVSSRNRLRIHLDYDIGQLSFYELSDPIRHLHTFTTTFSEPLHAAFCVWRNTSEGFWMNMVKR